MQKIEEAKRDFTGVWIPAHILTDYELTPLEKILYAEIASFKECYFTNEQLAKRYNKSISTIKRCIATLKEKGYVKQSNFNGRKRVLKAVFDEVAQKWAGRQLKNEPADSSKMSPLDNNIDNNIDIASPSATRKAPPSASPSVVASGSAAPIKEGKEGGGYDNKPKGGNNSSSSSLLKNIYKSKDEKTSFNNKQEEYILEPLDETPSLSRLSNHKKNTPNKNTLYREFINMWRAFVNPSSAWARNANHIKAANAFIEEYQGDMNKVKAAILGYAYIQHALAIGFIKKDDFNLNPYDYNAFTPYVFVDKFPKVKNQIKEVLSALGFSSLVDLEKEVKLLMKKRNMIKDTS